MSIRWGSAKAAFAGQMRAPSAMCMGVPGCVSRALPSRLSSSYARLIAAIAGCCRRNVVARVAKDLHFNKNMEALKKMQAGADKLATVVGVTIGPKVSAGSSEGGHSAARARGRDERTFGRVRFRTVLVLERPYMQGLVRCLPLTGQESAL